MNISQSLLKSLLDYRNGKECGLIFKAKYIDGRYDLFPPSDAQNVGAWFEYMATGSIPKNGIVPKAEYMKRGKDENGNPELTADYRLMREHIDNFKKNMESYSLDIITAGEDIKVLYPNSLEQYGEEVYLTGTLDVRARANKDIFAKYEDTIVKVASKDEEVIIDIKTTGLLDDKWNDFGWEINNLSNKIKLVTQPVHYKFIEYLKTDKDVPFIFMLFNSKNSKDARIIDFKVDSSSFEEHRAFIESGVENMLHLRKYGFKAMPSLEKCSKCPLNVDCKFKAEISPITVFYFAHQV
jgi:hypothetical protein